MTDTMETVTRDEAGEGTTERVGPFTMTVATAEPLSEAEEKWVRRAELLAGWLIAEWRREQGTVEEKLIDEQRRPDDDGSLRGCDLN